MTGVIMNHQDKFLLPDKSFWQALNRDQRKALISKYTIFCPPILLNEIAKGKLSILNAMLNIENMYTVPKWWGNFCVPRFRKSIHRNTKR